MIEAWRIIQHGLQWFALHGDGYQFWSGIGSGSPLLAGVYLGIRSHNCHVKGCRSFRTAVDPEHGWRACKDHHSRGHLHGVSNARGV